VVGWGRDPGDVKDTLSTILMVKKEGLARSPGMILSHSS
jgi:hypothetical protein